MLPAITSFSSILNGLVCACWESLHFNGFHNSLSGYPHVHSKLIKYISIKSGMFGLGVVNKKVQITLLTS